ncbi:hypothetical protein N7494_007640 [Penicillium frequentans]|uniref:Uncharacterized protein n=1 Tax=Penicillium frequentans TaxID=3151616 RepID=A0AAD6CVQ4_9EURO|nr:hypothetical protein N7494_007640 [Penicillium glabrum]
MRSKILAYIVLPFGATVYGTHIGLNHLEKKYPNRPLTTGSKLLQTPNNPQTQHCPYTDIYSARIPIQALVARCKPNSQPSDKTALEDAWARSLLGSPILKTEASIFGLLSRGTYEPGDLGNTEEGFKSGAMGKPRKLMNGIMEVQRQIGADDDSNGLLISWKMAHEPRLFFERIARWGYPWRLMSGGRHEMSVSGPFEVEGRSFVEVRFASAHDYEVFEAEVLKQKILPEWTNRLHRGFARLVLDITVRELEKSSD